MKLVATEYVTIDGVMEGPGELGWSFPFFDDAAGQFKFGELQSSDALLLGRTTYEGFAAAWPTMEGTGEFGEKMNGMPKYVVSSTLKNPSWNNTHVIGSDFIEEIKKLKAQPGGDLLLCGSAQLFQALMAANLIDEYRLMVHPVVFGHGKRLFDETASSTVLNLVQTTPFGSGVVVLYYTPSEKTLGAPGQA